MNWQPERLVSTHLHQLHPNHVGVAHYRSNPKAAFLVMNVILLTGRMEASAQLTNWPVQAGGNGHYYEAVVANGPITWDAASVTASNRGGYLATITSASENAFVFGFAKGNPDLWYQTGSAWGPWLGGLQPSGSAEPSGGWRWVTGESFTYSNWAAGQPNNSGGNENRIQLGGQAAIAGTWNDANDTASTYGRGFVIEYNTKPEPAPEIFFGEYVSPYPYDLARTVPCPTNLPAVTQAAAQFRARLVGAVAEDFERYATGSLPVSLQFGDLTAAIAGTYYVGGGLADPVTTHSGVFPLSVTNYLNLTFNATCTVSFSSPQIAVGFFGSDSETNRLRVALITTNQGEVQFRVPVTAPQGSGGGFFFGVIAPGSPFTAVKLANTGSQEDGVGIDDLVVASAHQVLTRPRLTIQRSPAEISWDTITNAGYQLQFSTNVAGGNWTPAHDGFHRGSGGLLRTNYSAPGSNSQCLYRLAVTNSIP